jgi:hypothetical protein
VTSVTFKWAGKGTAGLTATEGKARESADEEHIAIPTKGWTGPEGSRRLRLPDFLKTIAHDGGKVVSPTHRPPLPPGSIPGTHFC